MWWQFYGVAQRRNAKLQARGVATMKWQQVKQRLSEALSALALGEDERAAELTRRLYAAVRRAQKRGALNYWDAHWLVYDLKQAVNCFRCKERHNALIWLQSANRFVWLTLRGED